MNVGQRLEAAIGLIGRCETIYDIGCDHGYLPIEMARRGLAQRLCFCDISEKSLEKARANADKWELAGVSRFIAADGLAAVNPMAADAVCISGMGGNTVAGILGAKQPLECPVIVQANSEIGFLRTELMRMGYRIVDERMIFENGRFYQIMKLVAGEMRLSFAETLLGPVLLAKRPPVLRDYVLWRMKVLNRALDGAGEDETDRRPIIEELEMLGEVIKDFNEGFD